MGRAKMAWPSLVTCPLPLFHFNVESRFLWDAINVGKKGYDAHKLLNW